MILSIDVGIKNLAMCLLDESNDNHIVQWDVSGVPPEHSDGLFSSLNKHLNTKPWILGATTVLIEKQPGMNKKMKTVENFLHAYFVIKNPTAETIIYDARHKVPDVAGTGKTKYRERKQTGIVRCREFLEVNETNKEWRELFKTSKKKDDLADTVLQALSYTKRIVPLPSVKEKQKETVKSRKPTENQKATKYSKSNLAWMVKNHTQEELEKDKRFQKDLKRYYVDLDELKASL
jgi:hypothetical protein